MFTHPTKLFLATGVAALSLLGMGAASLAAGLIIPNPGPALGPDTSFAMTLPPLEVITFTTVAPENVQAPDARPFAVFNAATTQAALAVSASFLAQYDAAQHQLVGGTSKPLPDTGEPPTAGDISFAILATLKYYLPEGVVLVSTTQPSATALKHRIFMGQQAITLANGTPAWLLPMDQYLGDTAVTARDREFYFPNRVLWAQDNLIITVASALPMARVQELAAQVVLK